MKYLLVLTTALWFLNHFAYGLECPTCFGSHCDGAIPIQKCTRHIPKLPFKLPRPDPAKSDYSCLELEYFEGDEINQIKQCYLMERGSKICDMLRKSVDLIGCSTMLPDDQPNADIEGSGDDNYSYDLERRVFYEYEKVHKSHWKH